MFCTNCGASTKNGADLCVNCGESLRSNQIEDRLSRLRALNDAPSSSKFDVLHTLFDFSFRRPVTLKMMKFLYILSVLFAGLWTLFLVLSGLVSLWVGLSASDQPGIPLTMIFSRVFLEIILVVFGWLIMRLTSGQRKEAEPEGINGMSKQRME
jgi:hypothetical protein